MKNKGLSLVEIMITLAIVASVLSLGIVTMSGYLPKQRLNSSLEMIENLMHRAQAEALAKNFKTCLKFPSENQIELWVNINKNNVCGDLTAPSDQKISITNQFKKNVTLAPTSNSGCTHNLSTSSAIWFLPNGVPESDYQIVLTNPKLASSSRAREIELTGGGLIQIVKPGEKGFVSTLWAKWPNNEGGCE